MVIHMGFCLVGYWWLMANDDGYYTVNVVYLRFNPHYSMVNDG